MARGKHTVPFRLFKRPKSEVYQAYISFTARNGQRQVARISTGCYEAEEAEQFCINYIQEINNKINLELGDVVEINTEAAFVQFFEMQAQYYNSAEDTLRKLNILGNFFNKTLSQICDADIINFINVYRNKGRTNSTINRYLSLLSAVISFAKDRGYHTPKIQISKYMLNIPAENVKYIPDWETAQKIIDRAAKHLKPIIYTALYTGMRLGNVLNLKWENINFSAQTIEVKVKDRTKQGGKNFSIPIVKPLLDVLNKIDKESEYVFTYNGKPIKKIETAWQNIFYFRRTKKLRDESLPYINFHTLRHTAGTWILKESGNLKLTQQILGHSDIKTTMKYAHVLDEQKRMVLDKVFAPKKEE